MKQKICTVLMIVFCGIILFACNNSSSYVNKDYVLQEETGSTEKQQINLDEYRIQNGAIVSLKGLIDISDLSLEKVCFYDADNLLLLYADSNYTRLDAYLFSLEDASIEWFGSVDGLAGYTEQGVDYQVVSIEPMVIMEEISRTLWVIKDKKVSLEINLGQYNSDSAVAGADGVFYTNNKKNSIEFTSFTSGDTSTVLSDMESYSYSIRSVDYPSADGKYLYASGVNKFTLEDTTFVIEVETGDIVADVEGKFDFWESDSAFYSRSLGDYGYTVNQRMDDDFTNVNVGAITAEVYFDYCVSNEDVVITEENDGAVYTFSYYDLTTMTKKYTTSMNFNSYFMYEFNNGSNYTYCVMDEKFSYNQSRNMLVFEVVSDMGDRDVLIWDINSADVAEISIASDSYTEEVSYRYINETLYAGLSEELHSIYEKYGVAIYIGSNIPGEFVDFDAKVNDGIYAMTGAVEAVKTALDAYPEGFFEFFMKDDYLSGINVYLVGEITASSDGYIDRPAGFVNTSQNFEIIALDINYVDNIENTMYHELAHAIYKRIEYEEIFDEVDYFSETEWNELNPDGFNYYDAYINESGDDYSVVGDMSNTGDAYAEGSDVDDIFFIDTYSKTFLKEDLARLMEYGMGEADSEILKSQHIVDKLNYYYKAIRAVWDTSDWPKETVWESNVYEE